MKKYSDISDYERLKLHKKIWAEKEVLRIIYNDYYEKILNYFSKKNDSVNLELGSGSGNFKEYFNNVITSDIVFCDWVDLCFDGHKLPFKKDVFDNIIIMDVLHHLEKPLFFFEEVYSVLKPNGRLLIIEPYATLLSGIVYKFFHPEPFDFNVNVFNNEMSLFDNKSSFSANQAIPQILFFKEIEKFLKRFNNKFEIIHKDLLSFITYPLSGGFENKTILTPKLTKFCLKIEEVFSFLKYIAAFRCFVVLQKK